MRDFGGAFTAHRADEVRRSQDLMPAARGVLGHGGIELVLALLNAGRIPYLGEPLYARHARHARALGHLLNRCAARADSAADARQALEGLGYEVLATAVPRPRAAISIERPGSLLFSSRDAV